MAMRESWRLSVVAMLLVAACVGGCSVRYGQEQVAWHHDEATDELRILVVYEHFRGSEAAPPANHERAVEGIASVGGAIIRPLLLAGGQRTREISRVQAGQKLAEHGEGHAELRTVGYTRRADGRLGLIQHVKLREAEAWIKTLNQTIDEMMIEDDWIWEGDADGERPAFLVKPAAEMTRTLRRWREVAEDGHAWVSLDGYALVLRFPVDQQEWVDQEVAILNRELRSRDTLAMTDYQRDGEWVRITLGDPDAPSTITYAPGLPGDYTVDVDAIVREVGQVDADALIVAAGPAGADADDEAIRDMLRWGPEQQYASSVLAQVDADDFDATDAVKLLQQWSTGEGERRGVEPPDIEGDATSKEALAAWAAWVHERN